MRIEDRGSGVDYLPQPRERDILAGLVSGSANKQIADDMKLSEGTVKIYVSRLMDATGMHSRVQLALWWFRRRYE